MELCCKQCGLIAPPEVREVPPHKTAYCSGCGAYIKHLRQQPDDDFTLFFGKFKGRNVKSMTATQEERGYLLWLYEKATTLKEHERTIIKSLIHVWKS